MLSRDFRRVLVPDFSSNINKINAFKVRDASMIIGTIVEITYKDAIISRNFNNNCILVRYFYNFHNFVTKILQPLIILGQH